MEKEINIAEILKDKPRNTKLYSIIYGECKLNKVGKYGMFSVICDGAIRDIKENGKIFDAGECTIYPSKQMRDWSKFAWKKGDVLYSEFIDNYCIFNKFINDEYTVFEGKFLFDARNWNIRNSNYFYGNTDEFIKVPDDNAKTILSNLAEVLGDKLNLDTLKIEKPQFKDGDIVHYTNKNWTYVFISRGNGAKSVYASLRCQEGVVDYNIDNICSNPTNLRPATEDEKQQLFAALEKENKAWDAEKKRIVDLPKKCEFKLKDWCLMRDFGEKWKLCQFAFKEEESATDHAPYNAVGGNWFNECIPYNDQTAHLLGTTDDWEGGE